MDNLEQNRNQLETQYKNLDKKRIYFIDNFLDVFCDLEVIDKFLEQLEDKDYEDKYLIERTIIRKSSDNLKERLTDFHNQLNDN